jgi:hypothetical protein
MDAGGSLGINELAVATEASRPPNCYGPGARAQNAPRRLSTAGIVFSSIDRSSMIDQRSR